MRRTDLHGIFSNVYIVDANSEENLIANGDFTRDYFAGIYLITTKITDWRVTGAPGELGRGRNYNPCWLGRSVVIELVSGSN